MNAEGIDTYPNELNALALADDTDGNGVFDPNDSHGNVNPDEGIFADHQALPGYVARDHFYSPSEVLDIPGGGDVMFVPGGAVSFQQGQDATLRKERLLWEIPPSVRPFAPEALEQESIVDAPTATNPIGAWDAETKKKVTMAVVAGVGIGAAILLWRMKR